MGNIIFNCIYSENPIYSQNYIYSEKYVYSEIYKSIHVRMKYI